MASRADALPPASAGASLGGAARAALSDLYYHSWRLVPANVVWSVTAIGVLVAVIVAPVGLVALPALALPTAGLFRMAGRIVRGQAVSFWDAADAWRNDVRATLALGVGLSLVAIMLAFNVATGLLDLRNPRLLGADRDLALRLDGVADPVRSGSVGLARPRPAPIRRPVGAGPPGPDRRHGRPPAAVPRH